MSVSGHLNPPTLTSASSPLADFSSASKAALEGLRAQLGLHLWMVTRWQGDEVVALSVVGKAPVVDHGSRLPLGDLPLGRLAGGHGVVVDTRELPELAGCRVGPLLVGSCIAAPIATGDGELFGSLIGVAPGPAEEDLVRSLGLVEMQARLLAGILDLELRSLAATRRAEQAESEALVDAESGLRNERAWRSHLDLEDARCARYGSPAAVVVLRVEDLSASERVEVGGAPRHVARIGRLVDAETRAYDVSARIATDKMALLLPDADLAAAIVVADRLEASLGAHGIRAAVSVGARDATGGLAAAWKAAESGLPPALVA